MSYRILMLIGPGVNVMIEGIVMQVDAGQQAKIKGRQPPPWPTPSPLSQFSLGELTMDAS